MRLGSRDISRIAPQSGNGQPTALHGTSIATGYAGLGSARTVCEDLVCGHFVCDFPACSDPC
jgi:hypothetical protein